MEETVQHVEEMLDASPVIDVNDTFAQFQQLLADLKAKIDARFATTRDPSTEQLEQYGTYPEGPGGRVAAYSGPEVDWMVHSWLGDPSRSFVNLHLTCWLGPQVKVPHLGIALLCWPGGWFYTDYIPRTDIVVDGDYFDRYYAPPNDAWLEHRADTEFAWFTSRAGFIRASLSPNAYVYSFERTARNIQVVSDRLHAQVDQWLRWVDEAPRCPPASATRCASGTWRPGATSPTATRPTSWACATSARRPPSAWCGRCGAATANCPAHDRPGAQRRGWSS
ncbi:oxidoreductase [Dactylosporangium cerinum]